MIAWSEPLSELNPIAQTLKLAHRKEWPNLIEPITTKKRFFYIQLKKNIYDFEKIVLRMCLQRRSIEYEHKDTKEVEVILRRCITECLRILKLMQHNLAELDKLCQGKLHKTKIKASIFDVKPVYAQNEINRAMIECNIMIKKMN